MTSLSESGMRSNNQLMKVLSVITPIITAILLPIAGWLSSRVVSNSEGLAEIRVTVESHERVMNEVSNILRTYSGTYLSHSEFERIMSQKDKYLVSKFESINERLDRLLEEVRKLKR